MTATDTITDAIAAALILFTIYTWLLL